MPAVEVNGRGLVRHKSLPSPVRPGSRWRCGFDVESVHVISPSSMNRRFVNAPCYPRGKWSPAGVEQRAEVLNARATRLDAAIGDGRLLADILGASRSRLDLDGQISEVAQIDPPACRAPAGVESEFERPASTPRGMSGASVMHARYRSMVACRQPGCSSICVRRVNVDSFRGRAASVKKRKASKCVHRNGIDSDDGVGGRGSGAGAGRNVGERRCDRPSPTRRPKIPQACG